MYHTVFAPSNRPELEAFDGAKPHLGRFIHLIQYRSIWQILQKFTNNLHLFVAFRQMVSLLRPLFNNDW
jgi:hypothetical protein